MIQDILVKAHKHKHIKRVVTDLRVYAYINIIKHVREKICRWFSVSLLFRFELKRLRFSNFFAQNKSEHVFFLML
jgi:hypothetical protein